MDSDLRKIVPASFYGISLVPKKFWKEYGYTLLTIAGSDGIVSDPELEWLIVDLGKSVDVPEEIIAAWEDFDYDNAELEDLFSSFNSSSLANFGKLLIYDAIRMASADGEYALDEKEQMMEAASIMNLSMEAVVAIEALVDMEQAVDKLRMTIF